jgi:methylenetetrahydrofolate--tRNA-(uracil-5-)-methyltransferase
MSDLYVNVIGAGLAGCECAYQLAKRGVKVKLYEMKLLKRTPAQNSSLFAELVCSNSLKSEELTNSCGLLKEEMKILDSLIIDSAYKSKIDAGGALAVNRDDFSKIITDKIKSMNNIEIINEEVKNIDFNSYTVIATGPLTSENLCEGLKNILGDDYLYFYDAEAPIISRESIDFNKCFFADRYGKGSSDYLNCPMNKDEYIKFYNALVNADIAILKDFEKKSVFEGCMPVEVLAKRGENALRFGPLKPVGITNPITKEKYYAIVQLRKENNEGSMFNIVGFQTNLKWGEQKKVFSLIPGLENAEFIRYGVMHKNTFINAPKLINQFYQLKNHPNIFIAGQLSGVEGYVESTSSGLLCGINMYRLINNLPLIDFGKDTSIGSLPNYISSCNEKDFQPMNSNYGIMIYDEIPIKDKKERRLFIAKKSLQKIKEMSLKLEE